MVEQFDRKLILETGEVLRPRLRRGGTARVRNRVQHVDGRVSEIISDPSYTYQAVVMTYPLIGNYGISATTTTVNRARRASAR